MKRLFAVLLAFVMIVSAMPLSAFAASYDKGSGNEIQLSSTGSEENARPRSLSDELFKSTAQTSTTQTPVDATDVSMEATDAFGRLLLAGMDEYAEQTNSTSYSENNRVTGIQMDGSTATVSYCVEESAQLVVALYTENEKKMVASGTTNVSATGNGTATVTIHGNIPEYYIVKGFLLDKNDHGALSPVFSTPMYTEDMIDLKNAKASDFDPEQVINLDDDDNTNFAVVKSGVTLVHRDDAAGSASQLVEDNDDALIYTIDNADEEVLSLKKGDILVYEYDENSLLVAKVKDKVVSGTTVTIYGDEDFDITDAFEVLKIEQDANSSDFTYVEGSEGEDVTYLGMVEAPQEEEDETNGVFDGIFSPRQDHVTNTYAMSFKIGRTDKTDDGHDSASFSGSLTATTGIDFAYYIAAKRQYVALVSSTSISGSITVKGTTNRDFPLASFIASPVPGVLMEINPKFLVEVSAGMTATFKIEDKTGGSWESGVGYTNLSSAGNSKVTVTGDIEIFIGIKLNPSISVAGKLLDFELTAKAGAVAKFTDTIYTSSDSEKHACLTCFDFTIKLRVELEVSFKILNSEHWKFTNTFAKLELQPPGGSYGYWSVTYHEFKFNQSCPHKAYKITVTSQATGYEGSPVYVTGNGEPVAELDDEGKASFYLEPGTYQVSANINGRVYSSNEFEVSDHALEISLNYVSSGMLSGKVCEAADRITPIENALVEVFQNGQPVVSVRTDSQGQYALTLRDNSYQIKISADGYLSFFANASVQPDSNTYLESFLMVQGEEGDIGTAFGYLNNALTGQGVTGATLTIRKNWSNTDGEIILTTTTGVGGSYTVSLPIGNYTVSAEKDGFISTSFNIVVQENNDYQQNAVISPVVESLDQVTIALRWGENPRDLDSHIVGTLSNGYMFHVYFSNRDAYDGNIHVANLDVDDVSSYGPEHITLNPTTSEPYYYYVYHYAGYGSLATSEAQVTIYMGSEEVARFNVPVDQGDFQNGYWNVFAIVDGHLIIRNTITYSPELDYASTTSESVATFALDEGMSQQEMEIAAETERSKDSMDLAA